MPLCTAAWPVLETRVRKSLESELSVFCLLGYLYHWLSVQLWVSSAVSWNMIFFFPQANFHLLSFFFQIFGLCKGCKEIFLNWLADFKCLWFRFILLTTDTMDNNYGSSRLLLESINLCGSLTLSLSSSFILQLLTY